MAAEQRLVAGKAHFQQRVYDLNADDAGLLSEPADDFAQARQIALQHGVLKRELEQLVDFLRSGRAILLELVLVAFDENA